MEILWKAYARTPPLVRGVAMGGAGWLPEAPDSPGALQGPQGGGGPCRGPLEGEEGYKTMISVELPVKIHY